MGAEILNHLRDTNGFLFWGSVTAIAAGATLLVTAVIWQIRRLIRLTRGQRRAVAAGPQPAATQDAAVAPAAPTTDGLTVDDSGYRPAGSREAPLSISPSLNALQRRLQRVADRLESLADDFAHPGESGESLLKHPGNDVEYVFKASRH